MLINDLPIIMCYCLIITIVLEVSISFILGVRDKKDILNILLVNLLTNPLVTSIPILVLVTIGWKERIIMLIILELLTLFIEGFIYYKTLIFKKINPYLLSLILNGSSYIIGEIINNFL